MNRMDSEFIKKLPAIYRGVEPGEKSFYLENFLSIFERVIGRHGDDLLPREAWGGAFDVLSELFHPESQLYENHESFQRYFSEDPEEFIKWISGWMALTLKEDWPYEKKKEVIAKIIPIYRRRGTRKGLEEFLSIYIGGEVQVFMEVDPLQVGKSSISVNSMVGWGERLNFFTVKVLMQACGNREEVKGEVRRQIENIKKILDMEKPVHTKYFLKITLRAWQLAACSTTGESTLLGGEIDALIPKEMNKDSYIGY